MKSLFLILTFSLCLVSGLVFSQNNFEQDYFVTKEGKITVTFIGHGTLMLSYQSETNPDKETIIHVDPYNKLADYSTLPKASIILVTHHHGDHLDTDAISKIKGNETMIIATEKVKEKIAEANVLKNGEEKIIKDIKIESIPAYNLLHKRESGEPFHMKGECNSYILNIDGKRFYIGGDTENTPEMKALKDIDVAFLPMNLPFTMTPEMVADAAKSFKPKVLYPYHYGDTDVSKLTELMKDVNGVEVRIRKMK